MQNTSTVGIPKNCMNWLVLGLTIYTDMEIKDALKEHFGLSDRKKIKGRVKRRIIFFRSSKKNGI